MNNNLTANNFKKLVLESVEPVIIEVTADWCGTTSIINPILQRVLRKYRGIVKYYKLDFDTNLELAYGLGVESVPVLLIFKNALLEHSIHGTFSANLLDEKIKCILISE